MRKLWWMGALGLLLALAMPARAQNEYSTVEVYAGYDLLHVSCCGVSTNFIGGSGQVSVNLNDWAAAVAEFAGYTSSTSKVSADLLTYTFGPRVYLSRGTFRPFAQILFGGAHTDASFGGAKGSTNAVAVSMGGGVDIKISRRLLVRPGQFEYVFSNFGGVAQNGLRYSAGIVFGF